MTTIYKCDICGKEFKSEFTCRHHESQHLDGIERVKYDLINAARVDICDYCKNSYYVYGCERDCEYKKCSYKNNYENFIPVEPLHNKRITGC